MDPAIDLAIRSSLAAIFGLSAWMKVREPARFTATLQAYAILPPGAATLAAWLAIGAELAVAVALAAGSVVAVPALATLLLAYSLAIVVNLFRGRRDIRCGCGSADVRLGPELLWRNAFVGLLAATTVIPETPRRLVMFDAAGIVAFSIFALLSWFAWEQVILNAQQRTKSEAG